EDYRFGTSPRAIREGQETSRWHPRHPAGLPPTRRSATRAKGRDLGRGEGGDRCLGGLRSPRWAETCLEKLTPLRSASEPARRRSGRPSKLDQANGMNRTGFPGGKFV